MSIAVETIMIIASKLDYMQAGEENRQHYAVSFPLLPGKSDGEKDLAELFAALSLFPPYSSLRRFHAYVKIAECFRNFLTGCHSQIYADRHFAAIRSLWPADEKYKGRPY